MTAILSLLAFIAAVLLGGALLAWPAHLALAPWSDLPFHKLLGHLTLLLGLGGGFIYLAMNGLLHPRGCGYARNGQSAWRQLGIGLIAGNLILLVIELVLIALGLHDPEPDLRFSLPAVAVQVALAALTGLVIGLVEETIFRGAIQGVLMKHLNAVLAVLLSAFTYAALHFIKYPALPADFTPAWHSGLDLLADGFNRGYLLYNFDKFITLFLLGVLLGMVRVFNGNILMSIGLHTGLDMMMKLSRHWTDYIPGSDLEFMVNRTDHQLGLLSSIVLVSIITAVMILRARFRPAPDNG